MRWDESRLSFSAQNTTNNYVCFLKKSCKNSTFPGLAAFLFFEGIGDDWTCPFRFDFFYFGWTLVTSSSSLDTTTTSSSACSLTGLFWIGETSFDFTFNFWRHSYHVSNKIPLQVFLWHKPLLVSSTSPKCTHFYALPPPSQIAELHFVLVSLWWCSWNYKLLISSYVQHLLYSSLSDYHYKAMFIN